ncbi:cell division transport system permease protein [Thermodesulfobium acidiphilum]|uniref:Cell division protein FtsX n=2 Tax=Thermodesulfobium acidiphilum TaxID=1794699 RepID=A0A2R4VZY5_THEAF|nr:cell division transport system permease protein [Thermodesulfobium acidiphilum]
MAIASIISISFTMIIFGLILMLFLSLFQASTKIGDQLELLVFLKDNVSSQDINSLIGTISNMEGVSSVEFVSKHDAWEKFKKYFQNKINVSDIKNPLPDTIKVRVKSPDYIAGLAKVISQFPQVDETRYPQQLLNALNALVQKITLIGLLLLIGFALASLVVISSTIKVSVLARREELEILELVGAEPNFIRMPYILEGSFIGLLSSLLAIFFFIILSIFLSFAIVNTAPPWSFFWPLDTSLWILMCMVVVIVGTFIGFLGSLISLKDVGKFSVTKDF